MHALAPAPVHLALAICALALAAPAEARQASLVVIDPDTGDTVAQMEDVSADGTILVGRTGNEACRWTVAGGYERLGFLPDPTPSSAATAISADGATVVGWSNSTINVAVGFRWDAVGGMVPLDPLSNALPVALSSAHAIGHSGQLIGGYSYDTDIDQGTVWLAPTAPIRVGIFGNQRWSFVPDIADDAPVAVGTAYGGSPPAEAFYWSPGTGTVGIGVPNGAMRSEAGAVRADGAVLFGSAEFPHGRAPYRWSANHGFEVLTGVPTGAARVAVNATNAAGTAAVGTYDSGGTTFGFYWSEATGMRVLKWFLNERGVTNVSSATRLDPRGISADGNVIVGRTGSGPFYRGFVARLSPTDPAPLGVDYCGPAVTNSFGVQPTLEALGSARVVDDDVVLSASGLPRHAFAIVLASRSQAFVPGFGGSSGNLCLGGSVGRLSGPGEVRSSGRYRRASLRLDLSSVAQPNGATAVLPGETWNFQLWYRDIAPAGATSNLTSGRSILFQ